MIFWGHKLAPLVGAPKKSSLAACDLQVAKSELSQGLDVVRDTYGLYLGVLVVKVLG